MNKLKIILDFILALAGTFFRSKQQPKHKEGDTCFPEVPDRPCPGHARKGNRPGSIGDDAHIEPSPTTGPSSNTDALAEAVAADPIDPGNLSSGNAVNLLGWCLIAIAGTSYLYRLLA